MVKFPNVKGAAIDEQSKGHRDDQWRRCALSRLFNIWTGRGSPKSGARYNELVILLAGRRGLRWIDRSDREGRKDMTAWRDRPKPDRYAIVGCFIGMSIARS